MRGIIVTLLLCLFASPAIQAQRTSSSSGFPRYDNGGKPDLTIDPKQQENQMSIVDRYFDPQRDVCVFNEGAVGGPGYRRLLRFDTVIFNAGDADLIVGDRRDPLNPYAPYFYFDTCHGHYHMRDFSIYELVRADNSVVVAGHKQGFCFVDTLKYWGGKSNGYDCFFQGITSGWADVYSKQLVGQWIDITGVPAGEYFLRVTINSANVFDEGQNRYPNVVETPVSVPDPRNRVDIEY